MLYQLHHCADIVQFGGKEVCGDQRAADRVLPVLEKPEPDRGMRRAAKSAGQETQRRNPGSVQRPQLPNAGHEVLHCQLLRACLQSD